jgi:hypothetical protein
MGTLRRSFLRLLSFFRSDRAEKDLAREIDAHLRLLEDTFITQGMQRDEARRAARRAFGGSSRRRSNIGTRGRSAGCTDRRWTSSSVSGC